MVKRASRVLTGIGSVSVGSWAQAPTFVLLTKTSSSLPIKIRQTFCCCHWHCDVLSQSENDSPIFCFKCKGRPPTQNLRTFCLQWPIGCGCNFLGAIPENNDGSSCTGAFQHQREKPPSDGECDYGTRSNSEHFDSQLVISHPISPGRLFGIPERAQGLFKLT